MTDVVWLILDSLSYSVTPFADEEMDTMPRYARLARERAVRYSQARAPGLFSASSHGAFFTGYYPSETGMHHVHPDFPGEHQTIAEALAETHDSFVITDNPFIHKGLAQTFDYVHPLKVASNQLFHGEGTSLANFLEQSDERGLKTYADFVRHGGSPIRSLLNGLSCAARAKLNVGPFETSLGFSGRYICDKVESYVTERSDDVFVVANFMDLHPPFDPSEDALDRYLPDTPREQLPLGVSGKRLHEFDLDVRLGLLRAAAWDLDAHLGPLLTKLLESGTFVVVTADHGHGFQRTKRFEETRVHVPLTIFDPDCPAAEISHTVNLIDLPTTTVERVTGDESAFPGESLLEVTSDRISITESIRANDDLSTQIDVEAVADAGVVHDVLGVCGGKRLEYVNGEFSDDATDDDVTSIRERIASLVESGPSIVSPGSATYSEETMERLRSFGYL